jgi:hypothetical protein
MGHLFVRTLPLRTERQRPHPAEPVLALRAQSACRTGEFVGSAMDMAKVW